MPSGVRKKRKGVSRTTAALAVVIIIIIIGVGIFMLLSAGGLANIGIGGNGSNATSNVPSWVIITTTNKTLAQSIANINTNLISPLQPPLILYPNQTYEYPVTVEVINSAGNVLNASIHLFSINGTFPNEDVTAYLSPSSGVSPFKATLFIITGSTISMNGGHDDSIQWGNNITAVNNTVQDFSILIANATSENSNTISI